MSTTYILKEKLEQTFGKEQFKAQLIDILKEENLSDSRIEALTSNFLHRVLNQLNKLSKQENFVASLIKGEAHTQIDIDHFFTDNHIVLSTSQKEKIHDLVQLLLANEMNEYRTFQYVTQTFPLFSFLKRELLEIRSATNIPQWKFIADHCPSLSGELEEYFINIANYKEISDDICARAVSALVKYMTGIRFDNTIHQSGKGWFPDGMFNLPSQLHNIRHYPLFLIAYSFRFTLEKYEEMHSKNEDIYDCFCYEDNMFRFALIYIRKQSEIQEFLQILDKHKDSFSLPKTRHADAAYVTQEIKQFFRTNYDTMEKLSEPFIMLLKELGVISAKARQAFLQNQRRIVAQREMNTLFASVERDAIINYSRLLRGTAEDIIRYKFKNDGKRIADKTIDALRNNSAKLDECLPWETARILSLLCDGLAMDSSKYIKPSVRPILKTKFTTRRINQINAGKLLETYPLSRNDLLKISYLQTLINFINENNQRVKNKKEMTEAARTLTEKFEAHANKILDECGLARVHTTFPLDGLILIALSSGINDKCIPEVFQACLPIKI